MCHRAAHRPFGVNAWEYKRVWPPGGTADSDDDEFEITLQLCNDGKTLSKESKGRLKVDADGKSHAIWFEARRHQRTPIYTRIHRYTPKYTRYTPVM